MGCGGNVHTWMGVDGGAYMCGCECMCVPVHTQQHFCGGLRAAFRGQFSLSFIGSRGRIQVVGFNVIRETGCLSLSR